MSVNKQLEKVLAKIQEITGESSTGAMNEWWEALEDRQKIEDVIDVSGSEGSLQNDIVTPDSIKDGGIEYRNLGDEGLDFSIINNTPQGSSTTEPYADAVRAFSARGSHYIPLYFSLAPVVYNSGTAIDGTYPMLKSNAVSGDGTYDTMFPIPMDIISDNTNKLLRYPTLRFEFSIRLEWGGLPNTTQPFFNFIVAHPYDSSSIWSNKERQLYVGDTNDYFYDEESSFKLKAMDDGFYNDRYYYYVAGELDLNQIGIENIPYSWFNYDSIPDTSIDIINKFGGIWDFKMLLGGILLFLPKFSFTTDSLTILRQNYWLSDKQLSSNGWVISKRARESLT